MTSMKHQIFRIHITRLSLLYRKSNSFVKHQVEFKTVSIFVLKNEILFFFFKTDKCFAEL